LQLEKAKGKGLDADTTNNINLQLANVKMEERTFYKAFVTPTQTTFKGFAN